MTPEVTPWLWQGVCQHLHTGSAFEGRGVDVVEYDICLDCGKDLRGELPELSPAEVADQLANSEE